MALVFRVLQRSITSSNITQPVKWIVQRNNIPVRILANGACYQHTISKSWFEPNKLSLAPKTLRMYSTQDQPDTQNTQPVKKPSVYQKLKQMYRDYWYVVVPVHMVNSAVWFGCMYYAVRSGIDVIGILKSVGISDKITSHLQDGGAGYFALALALYKLFSPLRYAVTIGGTTYAIKKLTTMGLIKPVPSKHQLKAIYQEKKDNLETRIEESKQHYREHISKIKVMEEMKRYKTQISNIKNKLKKT